LFRGYLEAAIDSSAGGVWLRVEEKRKGINEKSPLNQGLFSWKLVETAGIEPASASTRP
jgi:hypothetical protein